MIEHILFVGLNDKDTKQQEIDTVNAYKIAMRAVIAAGYEGASITESTGFYTHDNGATVIEKSIRIDILNADRRRTGALIEDLKRALNQESILFQQTETSADFV